MFFYFSFIFKKTFYIFYCFYLQSLEILSDDFQ